MKRLTDDLVYRTADPVNHLLWTRHRLLTQLVWRRLEPFQERTRAVRFEVYHQINDLVHRQETATWR